MINTPIWHCKVGVLLEFIVQSLEFSLVQSCKGLLQNTSPLNTVSIQETIILDMLPGCPGRDHCILRDFSINYAQTTILLNSRCDSLLTVAVCNLCKRFLIPPAKKTQPGNFAAAVVSHPFFCLAQDLPQKIECKLFTYLLTTIGLPKSILH